jgi:hypothetical protein
MTDSLAPSSTRAEQLVAAIVAVSDLDEIALCEAAMGPVDETNRPLVLALLVVLDAAGDLAAAIADNAIDRGRPLHHQAASLARSGLGRISGDLTVATTWAASEALLALPTGYRVPTCLDRQQ